MGDTVKPIIVTDAGFKVPWFRQILKLGWDFVGRTRQPNTFSLKIKGSDTVLMIKPKSD
jgi:hypothetical protein